MSLRSFVPESLSYKVTDRKPSDNSERNTESLLSLIARKWGEYPSSLVLVARGCR